MRYLRLEQYMQKEILAMPAHIVILKRSLGPYSRAIATPDEYNGMYTPSFLVVY
jgi:hypothetical protein